MKQYDEEQLRILKGMTTTINAQSIERPIPTPLLAKMVDYYIEYMGSSDELEMVQDIFCDVEGFDMQEVDATWQWLQQLMKNMIYNYFTALQSPQLECQQDIDDDDDDDLENDDDTTIEDEVRMITETIDQVIERHMPAEQWWVPVENIIVRVVARFGKDTLVKALRTSMQDPDNGWADDEIDWLETTLQEELTPSAKKNKQGGSDIAGI